MKWAVLSSGPFGALWLEGLLAVGRRPLWIMTKPPRPAGRGYRERVTPVEEVALSFGLTPVRTNSPVDDVAALAPQGLDVLFVVDCSFFIREPLLSFPTMGCINLHPSLLPQLRGAAPIQRALWMGLDVTGVTMFRLVEEMDAGPILMRVPHPVDPDDHFGSLLPKLARLASRMTGDFLDAPDSFYPVPQEGSPSYAPRISNQETRVDWGDGASRVRDMIRALSPSPCAWSTLGGRRIRILKASVDQYPPISSPPGAHYVRDSLPCVVCGDGSGLVLLEVQPEGKRPMESASWLKGLRLSPGAAWE